MPEDFAGLGIRPELVTALSRHGLKEPTPVQSQTIPLLLQGKDVIAQAQTGTGKTLAFLLPMLERIDPNLSAVQGLILTPTRELAIQITAEAKKLAPVVGVSVLATYGGQDVESQIKKLSGATQVIVATPGRLLDHLGRGTVSLGQVTMLVLDEADQMLHMGFLPEVEGVIRQTAKERCTALFSATMPDEIRAMAKKYMRFPAQIKVQGRRITLEQIRQVVVETSDPGKLDALCQKLDEYNPYLGLIFCRTKQRADTLLDSLQYRGYNADVLHGDLSQQKREQVMRRFREAKLQFLVATDVAARGIDVEGVTHVFNYDIPHDVESYIHRIGRTGRAGQEGVAVTFVTQRDQEYLARIERGVQGALEKLNAGKERPRLTPGKLVEREPRPEGVSRRQAARARSAREGGAPAAREGGGGRGAGAARGASGSRGSARGAAGSPGALPGRGRNSGDGPRRGGGR